MAGFDDLPDLAPRGLALIVGLLVVFWVYMKVKLLRERMALRGPGEAPPEAAAWQQRLAAAPATNPVLGVLALLIVAAMILLGLG